MGYGILERVGAGELMVLANYVMLEKDKEKMLRFRRDSFRIEPREIVDPTSKKSKIINAAVLDVIEEDHIPVDKTFSTLSDKLATALKAAHDNGTLYDRRVGITMTGEGFWREYALTLY